jgi:hypothetical protein
VWVETQTRTKRKAKVAGKQRTDHAIDGGAALLTRPDHPTSSDKFDRNAVDLALADASHESDSQRSVALPARAIAKKSRASSSGRQQSIPARAGQRASKPKKLAQQNSDADCTDLNSGSEPSNLLSSIIASSKAIYIATLLNALYASEEPFLNVLMETDHLLFNLASRFVSAVEYAHMLCAGVSTRVGETG